MNKRFIKSENFIEDKPKKTSRLKNQRNSKWSKNDSIEDDLIDEINGVEFMFVGNSIVTNNLFQEDEIL